jgi:hypothetical protein
MVNMLGDIRGFSSREQGVRPYPVRTPYVGASGPRLTFGSTLVATARGRYGAREVSTSSATARIVNVVQPSLRSYNSGFDPNFLRADAVSRFGKFLGTNVADAESGARISEVIGVTAADWAISRFLNQFSACNKGSLGVETKRLVISHGLAKPSGDTSTMLSAAASPGIRNEIAPSGN